MVEGEDAIADRDRATIVIESAAVRLLSRAVGDGKSIKGEVDAGVHVQDPDTPLPSRMTSWPVPSSVEVLADGQRLGELDVAAATERDGVAR